MSLNGHAQLSIDFTLAPVHVPVHVEPLASIYHGECIAVMAELAAASIDAIVCDPPYGLEFMGKDWDRFKDEKWHHAWALAAYRILKPGGHLLAFGGTRTFHRLTCALEDAGFEIRDCLMWLHGSGFPKSLNVAKALDGVNGSQATGFNTAGGKERFAAQNKSFRSDYGFSYTPATAAAKTWQGWGTALKPAWEPIILARKPLGERTVAANVLTHGTGAVNVDGCRIAGDVPSVPQQPAFNSPTGKIYGFKAGEGRNGEMSSTPLGRWPANVLLDAAAAARLDAQSGERPAGVAVRHRSGGNTFGGEVPKPPLDDMGYGDTGGASRFFYTAKADADDRDGSKHPTVKPVDLMKWLITLVTPPSGVVLDPFLGSGTTVYAARALGIRSIGIEREAAYIAEAIYRLRQGVLL